MRKVAIRLRSIVLHAIRTIAINAVTRRIQQGRIVGMQVLIQIGIGQIIPLPTERIARSVAFQFVMHQNLFVPVRIGREKEKGILRRPEGKGLYIDGVILRPHHEAKHHIDCHY